MIRLQAVRQSTELPPLTIVRYCVIFISNASVNSVDRTGALNLRPSPMVAENAMQISVIVTVEHQNICYAYRQDKGVAIGNSNRIRVDSSVGEQQHRRKGVRVSTFFRTVRW